MYSDILQNVPFRSQILKIFFVSSGNGALTPNHNPADALARRCFRVSWLVRTTRLSSPLQQTVVQANCNTCLFATNLTSSYTQGEVTSRSLWSRYDRHFVGIMRSVRWRRFITVANISESFTYKVAAKINWHRYGTKLRHCHRLHFAQCWW